jgi:hypothetical protein
MFLEVVHGSENNTNYQGQGLVATAAWQPESVGSGGRTEKPEPLGAERLSGGCP